MLLVLERFAFLIHRLTFSFGLSAACSIDVIRELRQQKYFAVLQSIPIYAFIIISSSHVPNSSRGKDVKTRHPAETFNYI